MGRRSVFLAQASRQVSRQYVRPLRQASGRRQIRFSCRLCLFYEALNLSDHGLLLFRQTAISNRSQATLGARQALINREVILALLVG